VRIFLLGTLSAILLGLLVGAGSLITARRGGGAGPETEVADDDERQTRAAVATVRRRVALPSVDARCVPRPGWACWRGRLRLSGNLVREWRARRAARRARRMTTAAEAGEDSMNLTARVRPRASLDTDDSAQVVDPVIDLADVALPPDSGFRAFFELRVYQRDDAPGAKGRTAGGDGVPGGSVIKLEDDGAFEVHLPPGRYGLAVRSGDELLAGGRDELRAVAGDAEDGVDVVLEPTVSLAGRVLDEDGLLLSAVVTISRAGDAEEATITQSSGTFQFDDLRSGPVRVTAEADDGQTTTATFAAPLQDAVVHLTRPRAGLLLVPRSPNGSCPRGLVSLKPHPPEAAGPARDDELSREALSLDAPPRTVRIIDCQAIVANVAPGSAWDVAGSLGPTAIKTRVQFDFGSPLAPICLASGCDPTMAVLDLQTVDIAGMDLEATVTVKASLPGGPRVGTILYPWRPGLPANQSFTVDVSVGATSVTRQLWLRPGVNREVVRLPVRRADVEEQEVVTVE